MQAKRPSLPNSAARLERLARKRADEEARRIPWQRLYDTRNQYIDRQEFCFWVRSMIEIEERIPEWLRSIIDHQCPEFLRAEQEVTSGKNTPLPLRLEDWIDNHIFGFAKQEGWFNAITFYAIREPRYQRAEVCWWECVERWYQAKPLKYPSFEEWKEMAARCDDTAHLLPEVRKAMASTKRVAPNRLAEAVSRYMDWDAFAYWARTALEVRSSLPNAVVCELGRRCPGFLEARPGARDGQQLMCWIADHNFQDAKEEGWFEAILIAVRNNPRAIRTVEYADHCDELWSSRLPEPYPSFEEWRSNADEYVEPPE